MTFTLVWPTGLTDDSSLLRATKLEQLDDEHTKALDGAGGGTVAPSTAIQIDGAGIGSNNLQSTTVGSGATLIRHPQGHIPQLVDLSSITDTATVQVADMTADVYVLPAAHVNTLTIRLATSTGNLPVEGSILELLRVGTASNAADIESEDAPGTPIATIPAAYSNQVANSPLNARFYFDGASWKQLRFTADVSP